MAGEYVEFVINSQPALNEDNLNLMQQRIKQDIQGAVSGDTLPVGAIMPFGSDIIPENWLLCNGQAVSRTEYQDLFNTIGITFGQGDGFTTFNLPDLQGKTIVGKDENDTDFDVIGETGGEKTHTLNIQEIPSHDHAYTEGQRPLFWDANMPALGGLNSGNTVQSDWSLKTRQAGGGQAHNNLQPYQVQNYIIKAKQTAGVVAQVIDGLTSTSQTNALSANQGKVLNEKFNYSTTEKQIGIWSDNKPMYRRVINTTTGDTSDVWKVITSTSNINKLINICGYMLADTTRSIPFSSPYQAIWFDVDGNGNLRVATHGDGLLNKNIEVAIEYTKPTDL